MAAGHYLWFLAGNGRFSEDAKLLSTLSCRPSVSVERSQELKSSLFLEHPVLRGKQVGSDFFSFPFYLKYGQSNENENNITRIRMTIMIYNPDRGGIRIRFPSLHPRSGLKLRHMNLA